MLSPKLGPQSSSLVISSLMLVVVTGCDAAKTIGGKLIPGLADGASSDPNTLPFSNSGSLLNPSDLKAPDGYITGKYSVDAITAAINHREAFYNP